VPETSSVKTDSPVTADQITNQNKITVARMMQIAEVTGARRYLEVGVFKGQTFLNIDLPEMDAVDPDFRFDPADHPRAGRVFHKMPSDDFFKTRTGEAPYDLIFLDGLHTFEQTFRDFCATMTLSHAGTVWVIDDTVPSDMFSAIPSQKAANDLRAQMGIRGRKWHGDVYKMLFAVHDFFPTFDYRTVTDDGNEQTVIIRAPRVDFRPRWNNLERISRLDYRDFLNNLALMQEARSEDMFAWLKAANLPSR
jgi:hypothetical protein